jgi:hypothetical protein
MIISEKSIASRVEGYCIRWSLDLATKIFIIYVAFSQQSEGEGEGEGVFESLNFNGHLRMTNAQLVIHVTD